jgi:hypothetical protein
MIHTRDLLRAVAAGVLAWVAALALLIVVGLVVGCGGAPTVEFVEAQAEVNQTPTETQIHIKSNVLLAGSFPADFGAQLWIVDGDPHCWAVYGAGIRYAPPEVLDRGDCLDWLADLDAPATYSATGALEGLGEVATVVGNLLGGVLGSLLGL